MEIEKLIRYHLNFPRKGIKYVDIQPYWKMNINSSW